MIIHKREKLPCIIAYLLLFSIPLFTLPEPALIIAQQEEGQRLLEQGKQDYMEGRFEEAMDKLSLAIDLLTDKDKLIDAYLHLALCHFALGERGKAKESLAGLLRLNPTQKLDPLYYPPDFVKLLKETKGVVLASILVESNPSSAQVYLDGTLEGIAPLEITEIAGGEHRLKIVKQGYKVWEESLILKEGEKRTLSINLAEGKKPAVAVTPAEKKPEVKKGKGWLWILIGGAAAAAVAILASKGGKEAGAGPSPTQGFGSIQVKSYPNGAAIFLDGNNTGYRTNHTLTNISVGRHTILLRLAGWKDWQEEVTVNRDQTAVVKPCLLPPNGCFRDNFQDGDVDGWELSGWDVKKEGGNYFLQGKSSNYAACDAVPQLGNIRNFSLTFRLKVVSLVGDNGVFIIDFREGLEGDYSFIFEIISIWCVKCLVIWEYCLTLGRTSRGIERGKWHDVKIVANGDNIQLFINNILIFNIHDHEEKLKKGSFKFRVQNGAHVHIDDVVITSNECQ